MVNKFFIKIDRVKSLSQALEFEKLGVDLIAVCLNEWISLNLLIELKNKLNNAKLVIDICNEDELNRLIISKINPDFIQVQYNRLLSIEEKIFINKLDIGIIYSNITVSYDDDPSWIISDDNQIENCFYQIDLLADVENSWEFLNIKTPDYEEELQILDIVKLGKLYPIMISLDFSIQNVKDILFKIESEKGIFMRLKDDKEERNDLHYFDYDYIINLLKFLDRSGNGTD